MFADKLIDLPFRPLEPLLVNVFNRMNRWMSLVIKLPLLGGPIKPFALKDLRGISTKARIPTQLFHYLTQVHLWKDVGLRPRIRNETSII